MLRSGNDQKVHQDIIILSHVTEISVKISSKYAVISIFVNNFQQVFSSTNNAEFV